MVRFAERFPTAGLALSLHSARGEVRGQIMPIARRHTLADLREALVRVTSVQRRPVMIEYIRRSSVSRYGGKRGEIGWILEDNQGMVAIADAIGSKINKQYNIYEKAL